MKQLLKVALGSMLMAGMASCSKDADIPSPDTVEMLPVVYKTRSIDSAMLTLSLKTSVTHYSTANGDSSAATTEIFCELSRPLAAGLRVEILQVKQVTTGGQTGIMPPVASHVMVFAPNTVKASVPSQVKSAHDNNVSDLFSFGAVSVTNNNL